MAESNTVEHEKENGPREDNMHKCILCQNWDENLTSTLRGSNNIRDAAAQRQDDVFQRISTLPTTQLLFYHMTWDCYRKYVYKQNIERAVQQRLEELDGDDEREDEEEEHRETRRTRSGVRSRRSTGNQKTICFICRRDRLGQDRTISKLTDKTRAQQILNLSRKTLDELFTHTSHFSTARDMIAANLHYHPKCLKSYERMSPKKTPIVGEGINNNNCMGSGSRDTECSQEEIVEPGSRLMRKRKIIKSILETLKSPLESGKGFTLTEIRDKINSSLNAEFAVRNRDVQDHLVKMYGDEIQFCTPDDQSKSAFVFHKNVTLEKLAIKYFTQNIFKECGKKLRDILLKVEFDIEDTFCDETVLRQAWNDLKLVPEALGLFSGLFNFQEEDFDSSDECGDTECEEEELDQSKPKRRKLSSRKKLKIKSLYQIIYYILHNGMKETPFHVMTGLSTHAVSKNSFLVKSMNRSGVSISYDQVQRRRTKIAANTMERSQLNVPIPSQFDLTKFTTAAFDNFDHDEVTTSGLNGAHDTVSVLFQDESLVKPQKPKISETNIGRTGRTLQAELPCQQQKEFLKPTSPTFITVNAPTTKHLTRADEFDEIRPDDLIYSLSRIKVDQLPDGDVLERNEFQEIPGWSAFNSILTNDTRPKQIVGFLPILPHPVTEYATVYSSMCNFNNVLGQLSQSSLPVFCDEGVYHIAKHIQLLRPEEFSNLVLMLGNFHLIKVVLACIGKYMKDSGVEDIFKETKAYGIQTVEQVMSGSCYARSMKGFMRLGEAIRRLQLEAFFHERDLKPYENEIVSITMIQDTLREHNYDEAQGTFNALKKTMGPFITDFSDFIKTRSEESELFKYWSNVEKMIQVLRDLVRADRCGDWDLHIKSLKRAQPLFQAFDRTNYARWASVYLNDMLLLPETHPDVNTEFLAGRFTVKQSKISFISVPTDQALEQTINRSQRSSSGIIGSTRKKEFIALWSLVYHEIHAITNLYREITGLKNENHELRVHHDMSLECVNQEEAVVQGFIGYIREHGNPFKPGSEPLRNISTGVLVSSQNIESILNALNTGCEIYETFYSERFEKKSLALSATIHKANLPSFKDATKETPQQTSRAIKRDNQFAQQLIKLANERHYSLQRLLTFELTDSNPLFERDGTLCKDKTKSRLTDALLSVLDEGDSLIKPTNLDEFCVVVDVMLHCRKIKWDKKKLHVFKDFAEAFCNSVVLSSSSKVKRIDFIFDCYLDLSPKAGERKRRCLSEGIALHDIVADTKIPPQENKFWSHTNNKVLLQNFLRSYILENGPNIWPDAEIILSATDTQECQSNQTRSPSSLLKLQNTKIEEADVRMMLHISHAAIENQKNVLVLSSDTDILVLILYHYETFGKLGLKQLVMALGLGARRKFAPVHIIAARHGSELCRTLPALHHLTGSDYTSKVGRGKRVAFNCNPQKYLKDFACGTSEMEMESSITHAEQYLIRVCKKTSVAKNFDEFRYSSYCHNANLTISELPPTSNSMRLHILRAFYITYQQNNCLNDTQLDLDPCNFGFYIENDMLCPSTVTNKTPSIFELPPSCTCGKCARKTCPCVASGVPCTSYCSCRKSDCCKNRYNPQNSLIDDE